MAKETSRTPIGSGLKNGNQLRLSDPTGFRQFNSATLKEVSWRYAMIYREQVRGTRPRFDEDKKQGRLSVFPEDAAAKLYPNAVVRDLKRGEEAGSLRTSTVGIIVQGWFKFTRFDEYGEPYAVSLRRPGWVLGLESLICPEFCPPETVALTPSRLLVLPYFEFEALLSTDALFARSLACIVVEQGEADLRRGQILRSTRVRVLLTTLLYALALEQGEQREGAYWFHVPFTQSDIGDLLDLRRETVSAGLSELAKEGVISRLGRDYIIDVSRARKIINHEQMADPILNRQMPAVFA
jgi:CRP-like cAMP-binding protein